ncbi:MAG: peptidylprolyl isomerase [Burkholderiales bacterium]|nr:peptidylprolyl isomerase [Burkholderiales bacterium]
MNAHSKARRWATLLALLPLIAACGGGSGEMSMSNANATGARFSQTMTITFNGYGLDQGVEAWVEGPCTDLATVGVAATVAQFTCVVGGLGPIVVGLAGKDGGTRLGSLRVEIPVPRVVLGVTDGTRSGSLIVEVDPVAAPLSATRFLANVNSGFYAASVFHRVVQRIGILGGGYGVGTDEALVAKELKLPDLPVERSTLSNLRGTLAMYRDGDLVAPNSMFLINTVDNPQFDFGTGDEGFTVFGRVVEGLAIMDEVAAVPVHDAPIQGGFPDVPVTAVRISSAAQVR